MCFEPGFEPLRPISTYSNSISKNLTWIWYLIPVEVCRTRFEAFECNGVILVYWFSLCPVWIRNHLCFEPGFEPGSNHFDQFRITQTNSKYIDTVFDMSRNRLETDSKHSNPGRNVRMQWSKTYQMVIPYVPDGFVIWFW